MSSADIRFIPASPWQVVLPHIAPLWNVEDCLKSMGDIAVPLLLVDNSPDSNTKQLQLPVNVEPVYHPQNLGVAGSWNLALRRQAEFTLIVSASMRFRNGLAAFLEEAQAHMTEWGLGFYQGLHLMVLTRAVVERVGWFDEHYYPAYFEDNDFWYRAVLSGLPKEPIQQVVTDQAFCIGNALALRSGVSVALGENEAYYKTKWGGLPWHETYSHPFNNPAYDYRYTGDA